jgi:hypothetical protein
MQATTASSSSIARGNSKNLNIMFLERRRKCFLLYFLVWRQPRWMTLGGRGEAVVLVVGVMVVVSVGWSLGGVSGSHN